MGGLIAFTGARLAFLRGERDRFAQAVTARTVDKAMDGLYDRYFNLFPETKPHNVDPTPEELAEAAERAANNEDPHPAPVRAPGQSLSDYENSEEMAAYRDLQDRILARMSQILRWMRYHTKGELLEAHVILLNKLAGHVKAEKPARRSTAYNLWYKNKDQFLDAAIDEALKEKKADFEKKREEAGGTLKAPDGKVIKGPARVAIRQDLVKAAFDVLPKEEQAIWQSQVEEAHAKRLEVWANSQELHFSAEPEDRQRAIDQLNGWVMPLLEGINRLTGLNVSLFCSGPIPADQGRVSVLGMHCGRTIENPCETFGARYRDQIKTVVNPMLADFCTKTHTLEDCRESSLGPDAQLGKLFSSDAFFVEGVDEKDRARFSALLKAASKMEAASTSKSVASKTSISSSSGSKSLSVKSLSMPQSNSHSSSHSSSFNTRTTTDLNSQASANSVAASSGSESLSKTGPKKLAVSSKAESSAKVFPASNARVRNKPRPPPVIAAATLVPKGGVPASNAVRNNPRPPSPVPTATIVPRIPGQPSAGSRALPVGGGRSNGVRSIPVGGGVSGPRKSDSSYGVEYRSTINTAALKAAAKVAKSAPVGASSAPVNRVKSRTSMSTGGTAPPVAGNQRNPIVLGSSPPQPLVSTSKRRRVSSPITVSSASSSPIPSPTRKPRRMSSPTSSRSGRTASPHMPLRPVAQASPLDIQVKVEHCSPTSSASADEISAALSGEMNSSPVRPVKRSRQLAYVEIEGPRKKMRGSETAPEPGNPDEGSGSGSRKAVRGKGGKEKMEKGKEKAKEEGKGKGKEIEEEAFIVPVPDEAGLYLRRTVELASTVRIGGDQAAMWAKLLGAYVALEVVRNYKAGKLDTDEREWRRLSRFLQ
ncbi:SERTA domain-containing protein 3 [Marasmius crinis-equi]|uniref:SERTA domain-containing protein 3 n=1 Tax=Marasmius crinis-equi TaxID=585013 RepID=A0ABR3EP01_9AGAR